MRRSICAISYLCMYVALACSGAEAPPPLSLAGPSETTQLRQSEDDDAREDGSSCSVATHSPMAHDADSGGDGRGRGHGHSTRDDRGRGAKPHGDSSESCLADADCLEAQYCQLADGSCGGEGSCELRPDLCLLIYDPVCGCDGVTYSNDCAAAAAGVSVVASGECESPPPFCGGVAGFPCPGAGQCVDDPSDDCDPEQGGADCGGICDCGNVLLLCIEGTHFDADPSVCACVPDENPCAAVLCPINSECIVEEGEPVCQPIDTAPFCGGVAGFPCPGAGQCVDDPSDDCDPEQGGADCGGICDCGNVLLLCIEGTHFDADPGVCACVPDENPCAAVLCPINSECIVEEGEPVCQPIDTAPFCGGIAGFPCPGAGQCIDDPSDDCDPEQGGADCGGICECGNVLLLCIEGTHFDADPSVCACVPNDDPCAVVRCAAGTECVVNDGVASCEPSEPNPCAAVLCLTGTECIVVQGEAICKPGDHNAPHKDNHRRRHQRR